MSSNTLLWVAQALLAFVFTLSGISKSTQSRETFVRTGQTGVIDLPIPQVRLIGICELLGVAGLILPTLLGIVPALTALAAGLLGMVMILAARIHLRRREPRNVATNLLLLGLCVFVAIGRV